MESYFSAEFFAGNRQRLRTLFTGIAPMVFTANGLLQRTGDSSFAFRQDSSFWYLTGIDEPDILLVMDKGKEYLIVPEREQARETFDGQLDHEALATISGITDIRAEKAGWKTLTNRLKRSMHVATLSPSPVYSQHYGMYVNPARQQLLQRLEAVNPQMELLDVRQHVTKMRMVKQSQEIAAIQAAVDITTKGFKHIATKLQKFVYEYEIEAALTQSFRHQGAMGHAYQPIVASGAHACTLHYVANNAALQPHDMILIDVGAELQHYAADITRTFALTVPTKRQQKVFDAVAEVQAYARTQLKPGIVLKQYEQAIEQFMGEKLREIGLIKSISHETVRQFYPHATSHFLGLDVHDVGDYTQPLQAGMVVTIEPGIYIPAEGLGVRLEDDVLITHDGIQVMSAGLP